MNATWRHCIRLLGGGALLLLPALLGLARRSTIPVVLVP